LTRLPSEAADLTQLIARGFGPALADCPLARVISVNGVREKKGEATANQERNYNRHDTNPYLLAAR
jgi:hypothetical protein